MSRNNLVTIVGLAALLGSAAAVWALTTSRLGAAPALPVAELFDDGTIRWPGGAPGVIRVPPDIQATREFVVVSRCTRELNGLGITPSCGCTEATIDRTSLAPGESARLSYTFNSTGKRGSTHVTLLVASKGLVVPPHKIDLNLEILDQAAQLYVRAEPSVFAVSVPWSSHTGLASVHALILSPDVDSSSLQVESSQPFIKATLEPSDAGGRTRKVRITLDNPPSGPLSDRIVIKFSVKGEQYQWMIPVEGIIRGPYEVDPAIVNYSPGTKGSLTEPEVVVTVAEASSRSPRLAVDGDLALGAIEKISSSRYRVKLGLKAEEGPRFRSGRLLVGGDLGDRLVSVPVFITLPEDP